MDPNLITYKINKANNKELIRHLHCCDNNYVPKLSERVNISEYAAKLKRKAINFEAWVDQRLVGLVAIYFSDSLISEGFISNASIESEYQKRGIASVLLNKCINFANQKKIKSIRLEVFNENKNAITLYKKYGFKETETQSDFMVMKLTL